MATNQVLNAVDEIINGTPKYNITNNADGTKGIELANEVVQEGMALNKACLDKIDNVLSYLTPSVEKEEEHITVTESGTSNLIPTLSGYGSSTLIETKGTDNYNIPIIITGDTALSNHKMFEAFDNDINSFYQAKLYNIPLVFEFKFPIKITSLYVTGLASGSSSGSRTLYFSGSNDGIIWTDIAGKAFNTSSGNFNYNTNTNYYKYYKLYRKTGSSDNISIYTIDIRNWEYTGEITQYKNNFTLDNNGNTFANNQRVLVETPTNTTINNVKCVAITTTQNRNTTYTGTTTGTFTDGTSPTIEYNLYYVYFNSRLSNWTNQLNTILNLTSKNSNEYLEFSTDNYFTIDLKKARNFKLKFGAVVYRMYIKTSNDGVTWNDTTFSEVTSQNYILETNARYIKFESENVSNLYYLYFESIDDVINMDMADVLSNTLNEIDIDTLLQPSKYYEVLYNLTTNKFIAEEVRNAN